MCIRDSDHSFMVKDEEDQLILYDKETGRKLTMTTTLPCIQVYTGNFLSGGCNGKGGKPYENRDGVALEAQFLPKDVYKRQILLNIMTVCAEQHKSYEQ